MSLRDDAAKGAIKLVKWLADEIVPSAKDVERYGPNAARVRSLLDFIPTMSDEAALASGAAWASKSGDTIIDASINAHKAAESVARQKAHYAAADDAWGVSAHSPWSVTEAGPLNRIAAEAAQDASLAEVTSDVITPESYRILTNPLAAGRAVDVLRTRPRLQNTPFLDMIRELGQQTRELGQQPVIRGPRDVVAASRLAQNADLRETALALLGEGMSVEEAYQAARMLLR